MASWNRLTYPRRLFLWLVGYSLLLAGCFVAFQYHREKEFRILEINSQLQLVNTYVLDQLARGYDASAIELDDVRPFADLRLNVIDSAGNVIYDNTIDAAPRTNHLGRKEIMEALRCGAGYTVRRHSESTGQSYFYSATLGSDGTVVRTAVPYSVSLSALLKADYGFLWFMAAVMAVMCALGYLATRRVGQHISRLNSFAERVEHGEIISDTEPFPRDELGTISNNIVRLYARLQQALAERDREHLAALHEQKEKERIKKELTNNINHELKTPVASIRLCLDTMLAHATMDPAIRRDFLQRCLSNTDRLERLLADVSTITRIDDGGRAITTGPLDLSDVIADVMDDKCMSAAAKGIGISNECHSPVRLIGNTSLLTSVFANLADNAIAYSGGKTIRVAYESVGEDRVVIRFDDDGCGVPAEHLPRLFERFYRVDKGRSRAAGGTGLGLSIVKNAILFHHGTITVFDNASGGLSFRIILPL